MAIILDCSVVMPIEKGLMSIMSYIIITLHEISINLTHKYLSELYIYNINNTNIMK
jgi:hypothetical protein